MVSAVRAWHTKGDNGLCFAGKALISYMYRDGVKSTTAPLLFASISTRLASAHETKDVSRRVPGNENSHSNTEFKTSTEL